MTRVFDAWSCRFTGLVRPLARPLIAGMAMLASLPLAIVIAGGAAVAQTVELTDFAGYRLAAGMNRVSNAVWIDSDRFDQVGRRLRLAGVRVESGMMADTNRTGVSDAFLPGYTVEAGSLGGRSAWIVEGNLRAGLNQQGLADPVPVIGRLYLLDACTDGRIPIVPGPDGRYAITVLLEAQPEWLAAGGSFEALLDGLTLNLPDGIATCDPRLFAALAAAASPAGAPPGEARSFLSGQGTALVPPGWRLSEERGQVTLIDGSNHVHLSLPRSDWHWLAEPGRFLAPMQGPMPATLFGRPATLHEGNATIMMSSQAFFQDYPGGDQTIRGRIYHLDGCVDGGPVGLWMMARGGWLDANGGFDALLPMLSLQLPDPVPACRPWERAGVEPRLNGILHADLRRETDRFARGESNAITMRSFRDPNGEMVVAAPARQYLTNALRLVQPRNPGFAAGVTHERGEILGEPATLFRGIGRRDPATGPEWLRTVALPDRCLPDGQPVVVILDATQSWLDAEGGFDIFLTASWLTLPADAPDCDPAILSAAIERTGATAVETAEPAPPAK